MLASATLFFLVMSSSEGSDHGDLLLPQEVLGSAAGPSAAGPSMSFDPGQHECMVAPDSSDNESTGSAAEDELERRMRARLDNPQEYRDGRGRHEGPRPKVGYEQTAYEHKQELEEKGIGRACSAHCSFGRSCGMNMTFWRCCLRLTRASTGTT